MRMHLMSGTSLNPSGIRIALAPANDGGGQGQQGGEAPQGTNYQPGNAGAGNNAESGQDYGSLGIDPARFWETPSDEGGAQTNDAGNQQQNQAPPQQQPQQQEPPAGQKFAQMIDSLKFDPVFTPEIVEQLAGGDISGANDAIHRQMQSSVRESIKIMAQVTQAHTQQVMQSVAAMIKQELNQTNQSRDDTSLLTREIPAYNKRETKPIVDNVFQQSLTHTKGDRTKAIAMTKEMLKAMGKAGGDDFGTPPSGPDDLGVNHPGVSSLVESLLGRP